MTRMIPDVQSTRKFRNTPVPQSPLHEHRAVPRITPNEKITIEIDWSKGQLQSLSKPVFASGIDISLHGIQMTLDYPMPAGLVLDMLIRFVERNEQFMVTGTVVWTGTVEGTNEHRIGVLFNAITDADLEKWNRLLSN